MAAVAAEDNMGGAGGGEAGGVEVACREDDCIGYVPQLEAREIK